MKQHSLATHRLLPGLVCVGLIALASPALAQAYRPPSGLGAPARRESAGTRGCAFGNPASLIALMPEDNVGWTTEEHPSFYWYMPLNQASFVRFTLEQVTPGGDPVLIYQKSFEVTGDSGIMRMQLPESAEVPPLQEGDRYRWQVAIFCNPASAKGDLQVEGWVERHTPDGELQARLDQAMEDEKGGLYAEQGYWFDAVDELATRYRNHADDVDLQQNWAMLLDSVGLGVIAPQPFLPEIE